MVALPVKPPNFAFGTFNRPWHGGPLNQAAADHKLDQAFEFLARLGLPYFCFHDVDVMAQAQTIREHVANFQRMVDKIQAKMAATGIKLLWGTANLFSHPRYMAGGVTQVRHCLEATQRLGGENYVLWGGREGYDTLLNTNLRQDKNQLGRFISMVVEHKHKIGFKGSILIEPKPHEPTKHQYDFEVDTSTFSRAAYWAPPPCSKAAKWPPLWNSVTPAGTPFRRAMC